MIAYPSRKAIVIIDALNLAQELTPMECICGHTADWHRHLDECRFEDCTCHRYQEVPEE